MCVCVCVCVVGGGGGGGGAASNQKNLWRSMNISWKDILTCIQATIILVIKVAFYSDNIQSLH